MKKLLLGLIVLLPLLALTPVTAAAVTFPPEWNGDVNRDGDIDITDVTILINGLLNDNIFETMDVTADGLYNITDVTALINMLLNMPSLLEDYTVNGVTFTMRYVREATFTMGATSEQEPFAAQDEYPPHEVTLSPYYICRTEVSQELWHAVMGDNPCHFKGYGLPVEWVTWDECQEFIHRLNKKLGAQFRLPTEAEWEFASRGAHKSRGHIYSGSNVLDDVGWYSDNSGGAPHDIMTKDENRVTLHDMSGNVMEWCQDWYGPYLGDAQHDPMGPLTGTIRVVRGGSWNDGADACRVSSRQSHDPQVSASTVGLRIAMDARDPYWFTLSHKTVRLEQGEQATVAVLNGNGSYSIHNGGSSVASVQLSGENLTVTALGAGTAEITVTDNTSQARTKFVVIVTEPAEPWTVSVGGVSFKMIPIKGDLFVMGATPGLTNGAQSNERPIHDVTVTDYSLGETEVTQALWKAVMGTNPSYFTAGGNLQRPVEQVNWEDCWEFIYRLNELTGKNFRLPTEADWEFAARGGRKAHGYIYSGGNTLNTVAWNAANAYNVGSSSSDYGTHSVATRQPNELGLYDMSGNVLEWCQNLTDSYSNTTHVNPVGAVNASTRICRGGSWHGSYSDCRVSRRYQISSTSRQSYRGLRLAIDNPGPHSFGLSKTVIKVEVGDQRSVDIYNGSGEYTLSLPTGAGISCNTNGETLTVTGTIAGTTSVIVTDTRTHALTWLTVIVTRPTSDLDRDFDIHGIHFKMIYIPQGIYAMGGTGEQGTAAADNEQPVHRIALSDYYIGETEVTRALWHAVMGYTPHVFDPEMKHPMAGVSWEESQRFVARLSKITGLPFRLPTEAEWEYAARGARRSRGYRYAGGNTLSLVGWYQSNSNDTTHYVAKKVPNEKGIYDMSGNVLEWCQDWYADYSDEIQFDPIGPDEGSQRVVRGGAYNSAAAGCRVSSRGSFNPDSASASIGLRLALDFDNNYRLYLSRSVVWMEVGEVETVKILNGTGDYTITDFNDGIVDFALDGDNIVLTGLAEGTAHFYIKDNVTGARRLLTVYVTNPTHVEYRQFTYKSISWWMMYVRDGAFDMGATDEQGADPYDTERPVHRVALNDYYIGQTEVTQELWDAVMYNDWSDHGEDAQKPVECVNWEECQEFCARLNEIFEEYDLNFRLPTEAEWEFAARGGNYGNGYKYAGSNNLSRVGWYMGNAQTTNNPYYDYERHQVKTKQMNELRVYDMSGNVAEWCEDWYGPYTQGGSFNPVGPDTGTERVLRGGKYSSEARDCRVASRSSMEPVWWSTVRNGVGLRLAMDATGSHRFYLSPSVVRMYVGDHVDVNIYHGTGEYEITGVNNGIVNLERDGEKLGLTGLREGTATFVVTDTLTGERCHLTAIVSEQPSDSIIKIVEDSLNFNMIYVRGGTFMMGNDPSGENVAHKVILPNYYIGETEVTQRLWQRVMGGNPSRWHDGDKPVERVTWEDCQEFVSRLSAMTGRSFRLPTEAEWEYAARGGRRTRGYPYAGSYNVGNVAWYSGNSSTMTHKVMNLLPNELGIYDMSGNVAEWCHDVYGAYGSAVQYNPVGPDASADSAALTVRVLRGGAWNSEASGCLVTQRANNTQNHAEATIGLRLAMDAPTSRALRVSERVVYMEVGDVRTISVLNGSGDYTTSGGGSVVNYSMNANNMTITGLRVGTTSINIKDNVSGYYTTVTVVVRPKKKPFIYHTITFWIKYVWGGSFDMGATNEQSVFAADNERPAHRVLLPTYGLGMTEVTQELWQAVMGYNPSVNTGNVKMPVDNVTWDEAQEFVARLSDYFDVNFRLPTEAEWEYAARGAWRHMPYIYSGSNTIGNVAWYNGNSGGTTHVVETKQSNDELISDMSGNIDEWCQDWYGPYSDQPAYEPVGPDSADYHVVRGGRWNSNATKCRVSARSTDEGLETLPGVRIALELNYDYWFGLSRSVVSMTVGNSRTVKVYNGSGDYTVTAANGTIVSTSVSGDQITVTGLKKGRTTVTVYDNVLQDSKTFTAIVRDPYIPVEPDQPDELDDYINATMVFVKGGSFTMGATSEQGTDAYSNESPTHTVTVHSFMMSNIEVTQRLWRKIMGNNPSTFTGDLDLPVEGVTWAQCQEFIARLNEKTGKNYRLPTEAEWEYAARGGVKSNGYKYAGSNDIGEVAWYSGNSDNTTHIVGSKAPNELGIYDMSGNVFEWCQDWFGNYSDASQTSPTGPENGTMRIRRGGGYSSSARLCRTSYRVGWLPTAAVSLNGLRLVRDIENPSWFGLSESVIRMEQYEHRTVNILNGNGSYTVTGGGNIVSCQVDGERLIVTGLEAGTTTIAVTDNATGQKAYLTVVVTDLDWIPIDPLPNIRIRMVHVRGGSFTMGATSEQGSDAQSNESPTHEVTLDDYYICDSEVTQRLWEYVMGSNPSYFGDDNNYYTYPVESVTWEDCQLFIARLSAMTGYSFRLPTEAEWEYAARGGVRSRGYKFAGSDTLANVGWYSTNSSGTTHAIKGKNCNELTLYDMSGNVAEWCQDWYGTYGADALINPIGPSSGSQRIRRGGYYSTTERYCRVSSRSYNSPTSGNRYTGLRLAMDFRTNYSFSLSESVIRVNVGGQHTVDLINGGGSYTVTGGSGYVTWSLNGDQLTVTGLQVGTTVLAVTDLASGSVRPLTVVVTQAETPPSEEEFEVNGVRFKMITVDGGSFMMGASDSDPDATNYEVPQHQVTLSTYKIGQTEVTQELWQAVMGSNPSDQTGSVQLPVECVTWDDCQQFISRLNELTGKQFRLPTEAEWEFAARGGRYNHGYKYAGSNVIDGVAWYVGNSNNVKHPVKTKSPNELGIYDMSGNVWEWCLDWLGAYSSAAQTNPTGPTTWSGNTYRIIRGGAWEAEPFFCRVFRRVGVIQNYASENNGLRLALDVDNSPKFHLSETVVTVGVGESATVNIINGGGNYTVAGGTDYVSTAISGNTLTVTGTAAGTTAVYVTDAATGATAILTVIVTEESVEEHEYVDLGLPSGTLWATCNVGANSPEDSGDHFAWGETEPKDTYNVSTYKWCNGSTTKMTKYCLDSSYGTVDNKNELDSEDDAAYVNWGTSWRIPTKEQQEELLTKCTWTWTTRNGVNGNLVTGPNGNSIFMPAVGYRINNSYTNNTGSYGYYWSRTLDLEYQYRAASLYFYYQYTYSLNDPRYYGECVRPVRASENPTNDEAFTVNGITFKMITVDGGTFTMGDNESTLSWDGQSPEHQVTLSDYKIGQTQVTQALWQAVMGSNPSYFKEDVTCPVECVSWYDCQEFILKLNQLTGKQFRMLTEAEWEFAARGGNLSHGYKFSGSDTIDNVSWNLYNSNDKTHPVATKLPNELGIYDMTGNVSEWCQDWFGSYSSSAQTNPMGPAEGNTRVLRDNGIAGFGGEGKKKSFSHDDEGMYGGWYVTWRYKWHPSYNGLYDSFYEYLPLPGLRLALDVDNSPKFRLSETVVTVDVGESATVNILNGGSSYTVAGGASNVTTTISGNTLTVTGIAAGTTSVYVTDGATGATAVLNVIVTPVFTPDEHEYVDLGLPSGTLWATCNVGANSPEEYGDYFAWGETEPKSTYYWSTYKWCNGTSSTLTKYCTNSSYGTVDNKMELETEDDAATANWGEEWRMPTIEQQQELIDNCTWTWTTRNGVNGQLITGPNGNTLFLPAAGGRGAGLLDEPFGSYWSRTVFTSDPYYAKYMDLYSGGLTLYHFNRFNGFTVRPVYVAASSITPFSLPVSELTTFVNSDHYYTISNGSGSFSVAVEGTSVLATIESGSLHIHAVTTGVSTVIVTDLVTGDIESVVVTVITPQRGDVNCDGVIDENDYGELYRIVYQNKTPQSTYTADVNANGSITFELGNDILSSDNNALIEILYNDLMTSWNGYPFEDFDALADVQYYDYPARKYDINQDGEINIADFTAIIYGALNGTLQGGDGDLDNDGAVDWRDVCIFHVFWLKFNEFWPCETPTEHEYVDLGLPSGTLWAICNVGASSPEEYGDYFAWGETEPKTTYSWTNYKWCNGSSSTMTKYCTNSSYGTVDNKTELELGDDAAYVNWGSLWCMPSREQFQELIDNCSSQYTTQNGVKGCLLTGPNGNSLFLPAAGINASNSSVGTGYYWSRTLLSGDPCSAYSPNFYSSDISMNSCYWRLYGLSVRPVLYTEPAATAAPVITYDIQDDNVIIEATGTGLVLLYINGVMRENPCVYPRGNTEVTLTVVATAQEAGKEMSTTMMELLIPAKISSNPLPTDGQIYDNINGVKIENLWIQDRVHTPSEWTSMPYCNFNARTAVMYNGNIYISRSNVPIDDTSNQSHVYKVNGQNGELINDIPLTLNGEVYGNSTLSANNIGVDDFGHLYISPYSNNETRYHPIYLLNESTGELTKVAELDKGSTLYRCDYIDVIGDLTRQQSECNVMMAGSSSVLVYRWHANQGSDFMGAINNQPCITIQSYYPETVSHWGYAPVVKMVHGTNEINRYSAEHFYVDGYATAPLLYNLNGDLLDSFKDAPSECQPMDLGANGVCQFELDGRHFLVYVAAQYTGVNEATGTNRACQVYICELGDDDKPLSNMQFYWMVPDAFGYVSDGGTRIQSINVEYGTDAAGNSEVYLFIYKNYNGMAVYKISID